MKVPEPKKLPSGTWRIQLRLDGQSIPVNAATSRECKQEAALIKAEYMAKKKLPGRGQITLEQCIDKYVNDRRNSLSPSTLRGYGIVKRNRFQKYMGMTAINIPWQRAINEESRLCSPKTLKNAWGVVAPAIKYCGLNVPEVRLPQRVKPKIIWIPPELIPKFLKAIEGTSCELGALLALHSLRRSEIYGLEIDTWNKIDLSAGAMGTIKVSGACVPDENHKFVQKSTNKNASSQRTVNIMIPRLRELLIEARKNGGSILGGSPNTLTHRIKRVCKLNDLPVVTAHGLRHSFASLGCALGMTEGEIMAMGGWSDHGTVHAIYEHYSEYQRLQSSNKMSQFFMENT